MFALVDCNNFYASCERVFNPSMIGRPIVVLSNNDGCIIARSDEAKALDIKMGQPAFFIKDLIAEHNIAVFSSNYTLYGDMSSRVMETLALFTPFVETYSIDEAFLDLSGMDIEYETYGKRIRQTVRKFTGLPVCVGMAPTKTLAKIANRVAKKKKGGNGVAVLQTKDEIEAVLRATSVGDIWGIGGQYSTFLEARGIRTAYDFAHAPEGWIRKYLSVVGVRTKRELLGIPCIAIEHEMPEKKNIATTRSFGNLQTEYEPVSEAVATFAAACAAKLRAQKSCASTLTVFIHTNQFRPNDPQYARNRVIQLPVATNSSVELVKYAMIGLKSIFKPGYKYKKAGIIVAGLIPETEVMGSLFDNVNRERSKALMQTLDIINKQFGKETIKVARQGVSRTWRLRQEKLSPNYTTKWKEIITIKV